VKEAEFYSIEPDGAVRCLLCPHNCRIPPGGRGICSVRENRDSKLTSLCWNQLAAAQNDPVEKKPLYHFYPGSRAFSIATEGCNLSCPFCQNEELSLSCRKRKSIGGSYCPPENIVGLALESRADTLCFTYSEPSVYYEYMLETACLAKRAGLKTAVVSNGYINPEPLEKLIPWIDVANIDLKSFKDETYRKILKGSLKPVLETIERLKRNNIWVEITTLLVTQMNDSKAEIEMIAEYLANTDISIPWHISRFYPAGQMKDKAPTEEKILLEAFNIGKDKGLEFVYLGNTRSETGSATICPECGETLIERSGFFIDTYKLLSGGACPVCGRLIEGRFK
jgi:pyruvate formate lyase activating enzyme